MPKQQDNPQRKHRFPITKALLTLLLVVVASVWFMLAFQATWLAEKILAYVSGSLAEQGMYTTHESLEWTASRGAVLQNISLYRDADRTTKLLQIDDAAIAPAYGEVLGSGGLAGLLSLRNSRIELFPKGEPVTLDEIGGTFQVKAEGINMAMVESRLADLRILIDGDIIWKVAEPEQEKQDPQPVTEQQQPERIDLSQIDLTPIQEAVEWLRITAHGPLPQLSVHLNKEAGDQPYRFQGFLTGSNFSWRDLPVDSLLASFNGVIDEKGTRIDVSDLRLVYQGKLLTGKLSYDSSSQQLKIHSLESGIDFISLMSGISPELAKQFATVRLENPPAITATGVVQLNDLSGSQLDATVSNGGVILDINAKPLTVSALGADLKLSDGTLTTTNLAAEVFGGDLTTALSLRPFDSPLKFETDLKLSQADLEQVGNIAGQKNPMTGEMDFTFAGNGSTDIRSINAQGSLTAGKNEFAKIPLFGLLTRFFSLLTPGFTGTNDSNISMDYQLSDGVLATDNLIIHAGPVKISSVSKINLADQLLDIKASAATEGASLLITGIVGKLLEIEVGGAFDQPKWKFKNMPFMSSPDDVSQLEERINAAEDAATAEESEAAEQLREQQEGGILKKTGRSIDRIFGGGNEEEADSTPADQQ